MRTSATGKPTKAHGRASGFTLVELLVVLAIMALAAGAVALTLPSGDRVADDAERFAARAQAAGTYAIMTQRPVRVTVEPQGYRFDERAGGAWRAARDRRLTQRQWRATALVDGGRASTVFDPAGGAEPLAVTLIDGAARAGVEIGADGRPHVTR